MAFDDEMDMPGEDVGGPMKIGKKKVSATGKPAKKAKKSGGKKSYKKVSGK